jgi:hypothetical protein
MGLPSDCVNCHLDDYNATDDPNHPAAGFPTDCEQCHTPTGGWDDGDGGSFNHPFQLVGVHATLDCTACHSSGVYEGLPSDCVDCHIEDYDATTDPDHPAAGFPTDCEQCHSPAARWDDGTGFEHPYQLVGVHATLDCGACHGGGVYAGTPTDCVGCHLQNYNGANDPNHRAAGFPTDCELCHRPSDASWNQGTFNHGYFPITGGPHASADCVDCHTNPSNFRIFNCLDAGCHPRSTIDEKHDEEDGYVYDSAACYSCHPDGRPPGDKSLYRMRSSHASR